MQIENSLPRLKVRERTCFFQECSVMGLASSLYQSHESGALRVSQFDHDTRMSDRNRDWPRHYRIGICLVPIEEARDQNAKANDRYTARKRSDHFSASVHARILPRREDVGKAISTRAGEYGHAGDHVSVGYSSPVLTNRQLRISTFGNTRWNSAIPFAVIFDSPT